MASKFPAWLGTAFEWLKTWFERLMPWIAAALTVVVFRTYLLTDNVGQKLNNLLPAALNVSAIAVGFIVSAKAILLSLANSRVVKRLRERGSYKRLIQFFVSATWWGGAVTLLSAGLLWLDLPNRLPPKKEFLVCVWVFCCGGCLGSSFRAVVLFGKLVTETAGEPPPKDA